MSAAMSLASMTAELAKVLETIRSTVATIEDRQQSLATLSLDASLAEERDRELNQMAGRIKAVDEFLQTAQVIVTQADLDLAGREEQVREYLERVENLKQKVANWASGSIK